jgi:uncharacterized BrkB/YihY/UPF0761 family membrane protein
MFWLTARGLLLTIALAVAGGYLLIAHRAHIGLILVGGYAYGIAGTAVVGFVLGAGFAVLYNRIPRLRSGP